MQAVKAYDMSVHAAGLAGDDTRLPTGNPFSARIGITNVPFVPTGRTPGDFDPSTGITDLPWMPLLRDPAGIPGHLDVGVRGREFFNLSGRFRDWLKENVGVDLDQQDAAPPDESVPWWVWLILGSAAGGAAYVIYKHRS